MNKVYLVRHCSATGQEPDAPLTKEGQNQALELASFFENLNIQRIVSSDYLRAQKSAKPIADKLNIPIEIEINLRECKLGFVEDGNWKEAIRNCIENPKHCLSEGESTETASIRGRKVVDKICIEQKIPALIFTHGYLLTLICRSFDSQIGYDFWENLKNPDVIELAWEGDYRGCSSFLLRKI